MSEVKSTGKIAPFLTVSENNFMKLLELFCKRETAMPMLALTFASVVCGALVLGRIAWTGKIRYAFLIWNLLLA